MSKLSPSHKTVPVWPLIAAVAFAAAALTTLVLIENQKILGLALAGIAAICFAAARFGGVTAAETAASKNPWLLRGLILIAALAVLFVLRDDNFGLLMVATVLIYATVCIGLTIQMGYAGLTNFAAAALPSKPLARTEDNQAEATM